MYLHNIRLAVALGAGVLSTSSAAAGTSISVPNLNTSEAAKFPGNGDKVAPKVFIFSMFGAEGTTWYDRPEINLLARNISVPCLSPLFPDVHCTEDGDVCQVTLGEAEINAASTVMAVVTSSLFDLTQCYFFIAGIAGVSPVHATTGSVAFARYAVQGALAFEIDRRELPSNFTTSYFAQGTDFPDQYPTDLYGTEVFEVNARLATLAAQFAGQATLDDSADAQAYRANYKTADNRFEAATMPPSVVECDVVTADVFYSGNFLSETFDNVTRLLTNGSGVYCTTVQEDNASLEVLLRGAAAGLVDFSRIIVMHTASDFDRPFPGEDALFHLVSANQGALDSSIENLFLAGIKVVEGILNNWDKVFGPGVKPDNYVGDIFATLGGNPDFGPGRKLALGETGVNPDDL
ncbi:purine nucleoside permease [Xylaria intraflava]|nr:purine nucleoside permease [Xylaria intraflava]